MIDKRIYEEIKQSINDENFDKFKTLIKNFQKEGITLLELRKDKEENKKIKIQLDKWLKDKCNKKETDDIMFLLYQDANRTIIYETIIESKDFYTFKYFMCNFQKHGINVHELKKNKNRNREINFLINKWLEEKCSKGKIEDIENIAFLLYCGEYKIIVFKEINKAIESNNFKIFKFLVENFKKQGITLHKIRENKEWKISVQNQINKWLEEKCREQEVEDIKFLLEHDDSDSTKEIIYKEIRDSIETKVPNFNNFKFFVGNFNEQGIALEKIKNDTIQNQINKWLEEKCREQEVEDIKFLLEYDDSDSTKEIVYNSIKESIVHQKISNLKFFVRTFSNKIKIKEIKKYINKNETLQKQLNNWLEKKCKSNYIFEEIQLLIDCGAKPLTEITQIIVASKKDKEVIITPASSYDEYIHSSD